MYTEHDSCSITWTSYYVLICWPWIKIGCQSGRQNWHQIQSMGFFLVYHRGRENCTAYMVTSHPWLAETFAPKYVLQFGLETAYQWILHKVTSAHTDILSPSCTQLLEPSCTQPLSLYCLKFSMISLTETVIGRKVNLLLCVARKTGKKCRIGCGSTT